MLIKQTFVMLIANANRVDLFSFLLLQKPKKHNKGKRFSLPSLPFASNIEMHLLSPVLESTPTPHREITLEEELQERHLKVSQNVDTWVKKWQRQQEGIANLRQQMAVREAEHQSRFEMMRKSYMSQIEDLQSTLTKADQRMKKISQEKIELGTAYEQMLKKYHTEQNEFTSQIEGVKKKLDESQKCKLELEEDIERERQEKMELSKTCEAIQSELEKYKLDTKSTVNEYQQELEQCAIRDDYNRLLLGAAVDKLRYLEKKTPSSNIKHPADTHSIASSSHSKHPADAHSIVSVGSVDSEVNWHTMNSFGNSTMPMTLTEASEDLVSITSSSADPNPKDLTGVTSSRNNIQLSRPGTPANDMMSVYSNSSTPANQTENVLEDKDTYVYPGVRRMSAISDTYSEGGTQFGMRADRSNFGIGRRRGGVDHHDQDELMRIQEITKRMKTKKYFRLNLFKRKS